MGCWSGKEGVVKCWSAAAGKNNQACRYGTGRGAYRVVKTVPILGYYKRVIYVQVTEKGYAISVRFFFFFFEK